MRRAVLDRGYFKSLKQKAESKKPVFSGSEYPVMKISPLTIHHSPLT
jgi:hypothetical protein